MPQYKITSVGGAFFGIWEGNSKAEALIAMHRDAGYSEHQVWMQDNILHFTNEETKELCGDVDGWIIEEV